MSPMMYVVVILAGTVAVCWIFKWILDKAVDMHMPKPASPTTGTSPYRSSTPPTEPVKPADDVKPTEPQKAPLPVVTIDWKPGRSGGGQFAIDCPACGTKWLYAHKKSPSLCACNKCDTPHFHLSCSGRDEDGCGVSWIMRSALLKQSIITPPPGTTGTKEPS